MRYINCIVLWRWHTSISVINLHHVWQETTKKVLICRNISTLRLKRWFFWKVLTDSTCAVRPNIPHLSSSVAKFLPSSSYSCTNLQLLSSLFFMGFHQLHLDLLQFKAGKNLRTAPPPNTPKKVQFPIIPLMEVTTDKQHSRTHPHKYSRGCKKVFVQGKKNPPNDRGVAGATCLPQWTPRVCNTSPLIIIYWPYLWPSSPPSPF